MATPPTRILTADDVRSLIDMRDAVLAVEQAFAAYARGEASMPPKVYLSLPQHGGDFRAMPSELPASEAGRAVAGLKWVNSHPDNPSKHGLPSVMGIFVLSDPATALPLAVMDATLLTAARTGAAAAVATKYLARKNVRTLGFVGSGVQARWMLAAHRAAFGEGAFELVCADVDPNAAARFAEESGGRVASAEEAAGCDVVCMSTPGRSVAVKAAWLRPGCHVNAMGADAPGKQELESAALAKMRVYVDDLYQATHSGEINVALEQGEFTESSIAGSIGAVIAGLAQGRANDDERTLFDSTGLAIQDAALARVLLARAEAREIGSLVQLVG